jgi:hypothetical protein
LAAQRVLKGYRKKVKTGLFERVLLEFIGDPPFFLRGFQGAGVDGMGDGWAGCASIREGVLISLEEGPRYSERLDSIIVGSWRRLRVTRML